MASITCELTWLSQLLWDLRIDHLQLVTLFCDNQVAMHIAVNLVFHERIDWNFIREWINRWDIKTAYVATEDQIADIFINALG